MKTDTALPEWDKLLPSEKIELARAASASTYDELARFMNLKKEKISRICSEELELTEKEDIILKRVIIAKHKALQLLEAGGHYKPLGIAPLYVILEAFDSLAPQENSQFGLQFKGHYLAVKLAFYIQELLALRPHIKRAVLINITSTYGLPEYAGQVIAENTKTQTEVVFTIKLTEKNKGSINLNVTWKNGNKYTLEENLFTETRIRRLARHAVLCLLDKPIKSK